MERDFEQELKQLKQSEIPDLWNRIEDALPEKKAAAPSLKDIAASEKREENAGKRDRQEKTGKIRWKKWGTLAAACLCLVIVLPAVITLTGSLDGQESGSSSSGANDAAMPEDMFVPTDDAAAADETEAVDDTAVGESATAGASEGNMDTIIDDTGSASGALADAAEDDSGSNSDGLEKVESESESYSAADESVRGQKSLSEEKAAYDLTDGRILQGMYIHVTEAERGEEETIFHAIVIQADEETIFEEGTEITVVCDSRTEYNFLRAPRGDETLKKGENYEVSLCYETDGQGEGRLVILSAAQ